MRIRSSGDFLLEAFDDWTLTVGNGEASTMEGTDMIEIPEELCFKIEEKTLKNPEAEKKAIIALADHVYPNLNNKFKVPEWMDGRVILSPTN